MEATGPIASSAVTIFWMLVAVAAVALITKRIRLPYTVALVIAGLIITVVPDAPRVVLTPELILAVFLPVLVFEAAFNLDFGELRENLRSVSALAIPGVLITASVVALLIHYTADFDWGLAFLFGAIVAATDPVSVVATFRELGAPRRLRTIVEGESLFNDGTALVLFRVILGIVVAGTISPAAAAGQFILVILGGLTLGVASGYLVSRLMRRFDDYLIETVLTVILAYGTYFLAETFHVSGVIAVVGAGLTVGNYGRTVSFSPTSRIAVALSWEFFGFLANSLIFLFVGLQLQPGVLAGSEGYIAVAIAAVLLSRVIAVGALGWLFRLIGVRRPLPWTWQALLVWGGLRGSLSLAMALSLPYALATGADFPHRQAILAMTFGVILFTVLVQGLTLRPLLKRLGLVQEDQSHREYEVTQVRLRTLRTALATLEQQAREGAIAPRIADTLRAEYAEREHGLAAHLEALHLGDQVLRDQQIRDSRRELLIVERSTLGQLFTQGAIDDETWRLLGGEIDSRLAELDQPG